MNDESYPELPGFTEFFAQRMAQKSSVGTPPPPGSFDPYQTMLNKKKAEDGQPIDTSNKISWPAEDVKALEDFCKAHGMAGFSCGNMSPIAALAFLKNKLGIVDGPVEDRVPAGYERMGAKNTFNCNYPYSSVIQKKTLLKG